MILKKYGFSLIEILVVIAILGVLAGGLIVLIDPIGQNQKSKDARRISDLKQIQTGLELYRSDEGSYPPNSWINGNSLSIGVIDYIKTIPKDPKGGNYNYNLSGSSYNLYACAENKNSKGVTVGSYGNCTSTGQYILVTSP